MSLDRLTALRLLSYCWLTVIMPPNAVTLNVVYNDERSSSFQSSAFHPGGSSSSSSGRKFGGYRIVPRACKDSTAEAAHKNDVRSDGGGDGNGGGVCMFNYECAQMGGSVVGSCVDVFLFGACCRLPAGTKLPYAVDQHQTSTATTTLGRQPSSTTSSSAPVSYLHPMGDTILLHRNGTAVQNAYRPDDMSAELQMASRRTSLPTHNRWPTSPQPPADWHHGRWPASPPTSKVDYAADSSPVKQTSSSPVSKSTDSVPNVRKTTPSAAAAAHHSTTTAKHDGYADDYYDGMVLVPTLTVHDPNVKTPVENNSIHHILSILNQTPPTTNADGGSDEGDGDDPLDTSPSYQHAQHSSSTPSPSGLLYTWGSIDGDTKTPGYGPSSSASFPATRPASTAYYPQTQHYDRPGVAHYGSSTPATTTTTATSTHHLPGPHFHVTTAKPAAIDPIVPTVIVLSAANDKNPNKYSTTTAVYTSSYRPPPSHVKPSQSIIVTGKPSVSAAYTTTATYHHHQHHQTAQNHQQQQQQQQQQNLAFVPVSSTTLADHYYNSNNYNVHHTAPSSKPAAVNNYGHRPATTTTTTSLPPTLSSTVHHDGVGGGSSSSSSNNNVFTTVITSVNHQYHKYQQPATAATSTVARPVLNAGGSAAVIGGYRPPAQTTIVTDVDYPSPPVITPSPQVYITATDVQHLQHHTQQQPPLATFDDGDGDGDDEVTVVTAFNSTDTFAFPPVRDPNVNLTAQQEKPIATVTAVDSGGVGGDYDSDADPHPLLQADDNLDDKVHLFVEKVVQSLQGNFEDLERVLLSGDQSSSNVSVGLSDEQQAPATPNKRPTTTTRKPPRPGAGASKPPAASKPTKPPKTTTTTASGGTYRPTPVTLPLDAAPYLELTTTASRPTKIPALLTPVQLFQPTTYTARPPTKQPVRVTPSTTVVLDNLNVEHDHTTAEPDYRKVCGVRPLVRKNGRIVGGTGSTFGEWPWQVLVREATWLGLFTKNKCGGVLITQKHVITAAHCQPGFLANLVAVFGEYDISGEVESKRSVSKNVKRVIVHRQYDAATFENDIALLELESPVGYDQHIVPICMPDDDDDFTGRMASVTGWGRLKYGGGVPSILQEVQVPIIENQVCQDMFETAGHSKTILSSFLCAGYANGQRDSCEGDSGGPLMIEKDNGRWTLIGTVSHGIKCAAPYLPGVYMRTTYYKPWLQTITGVQ